MRYLIITLAVLIGGVVLGKLLAEDVGFVVIGYQGFALRTSLVFFCLLLIFFVIACYLLIGLLRGTLKLPRSLRRRSERRRALKAERALHQGLLSMAEGAWGTAERAFVRSADRSEQPLLHYLGAARAADACGAAERRDTYLKLARDSGHAAQTAVGLTRSELEIAHGNTGAAKETLFLLLEQDPRNRHALKLLGELYLRNREWAAALQLLPRLKRGKVLAAPELESTERQIYQGLLQDMSDPQDLDRLWRRTPRMYRSDPQFLILHCRNLMTAGRDRDAEEILRKALDKEWHSGLIALYGEVQGANPLAQLSQVERWIGQGTGDAELLRAGGRLAFQAELWGKARSYFEEALTIEARPDTYRLLGETLVRMGEKDAAAECTQRGLALATLTSEARPLLRHSSV